MAITEFRPENQNVSQAPTLGEQSGTFGAGVQQRKNIAQGGSGRFTNLQQYVQANEANNPNAGLLQREAQARQGELGTKQQQFVSQATPIKTGLETVRSGQQFVQSALENPTQYVTPERLQQFAGFRTSGVGDIETPFNQFQALRSGLGTQQEQLASGLETIKSTPTALQNFIQSQRANPALATRGENVLDRFLTQSTQSGQQAIAGLGTTASAIRQAQVPTIASEVEALRTQAQGGPLSSADVRNLLTGKIAPEEEFVKTITPEFLQERLGLNIREPGRQNTNLYRAQSAKETLNQINQKTNEIINRRAEIYSQIKPLQDRLNELNLNAFDSLGEMETRRDREALQKQIKQLSDPLSEMAVIEENLKSQKERIDKSELSDLISKLEEYERGLASNRQQLLQQYDPTRFSKIQALQQLAGSTQFDPLSQLLQQRLV